tara:strand:- start:407 stop:523 length:117 start_codon:yes stop_codon:yes gene_type:complete
MPSEEQRRDHCHWLSRMVINLDGLVVRMVIKIDYLDWL